jgi:hypothetical protein
VQCPWNERLPAPRWRAPGSSPDTRSGFEQRQSLRKPIVSNCPTIQPNRHIPITDAALTSLGRPTSVLVISMS